jgi:hypothetical protein
MTWYDSDVVAIVLNFLQPAEGFALAAVHSRWYRCTRAQRLTLCLHRDLLRLPASVTTATDMLKEWGPSVRWL